MNVSRRKFLGAVTGSVATLMTFQTVGFCVAQTQPLQKFDCAVLDLKSDCVLRESLEGYQAALACERGCFQVDEFDSLHRCRKAILPGLGLIDPALAQELSNLLNAGTDLLLESGAGFLGTGEFAAHQKMLLRYFDLAVESPVDLWSGNPIGAARFAQRCEQNARKEPARSESPLVHRYVSSPYIDYDWPQETKVRDFSRVILVSAKSGDVIARVRGLPVALKRRVGEGTLIFLGSPIGPLLRAGDPEARSWLQMATAV
jgi:hypothetical protein